MESSIDLLHKIRAHLKSRPGNNDEATATKSEDEEDLSKMSTDDSDVDDELVSSDLEPTSNILSIPDDQPKSSLKLTADNGKQSAAATSSQRKHSPKRLSTKGNSGNDAMGISATDDTDILVKEAAISEIATKHKKFIKEAFPSMIVLTEEDETIYFVERVPPQLQYTSSDGLNRWCKRQRDRRRGRTRWSEDVESKRSKRQRNKRHNSEGTNYRRLLTLTMFVVLFIFEFRLHVLNKGGGYEKY